MNAIRLQTEYLTEPLGLGVAAPRLFWNCEGGKEQTAYQIEARRDGALVWDTGKVLSARMTHILYEGTPLRSRDEVIWRVRLWDENDVPGDWSESRFELGLLDREDWTAQWMTSPIRVDGKHRYPVDCFRKDFKLNRPVQKARLYITACGLYEASINGQRVGDGVLMPGSTDYRKRIQYQTYDVTGLLRERNTLTVQLADGWYRGSIGCFGQTAVFGKQTKLLCQLEITCTDGSRGTICSDGRFRWSNDGALRFADLKDGEIVDARMHPSYSGYAAVCEEKLVPTASDNVLPKEKERFPGMLLRTPSGKQVLDFGQNLAGFLSFTVQGKPGQTLRILLGETLDAQGEFTQANFQARKPVKKFGTLAELALMLDKADLLPGPLQATPLQEIRFTCSGGRDTYKTKFAVFGFRYALVETEVPFDASDFTAIAVYSDLEETGGFACSHEGVNRILENTRWSMKSNYLDVPTDCPTRERLAWTGDAQVFFQTGAYLMNTAPFFRKWLRDLQDNQKPDGKISAVAPYNGLAMMYDSTGSSAGWLDAAALIPYRFWKRFGDEAILRENYPMLEKLMGYMISQLGPKDKKAYPENPYREYLYEKGVQLGEWLEPEEFWQFSEARQNGLQTEVSTAYFAYTMSVMAEIAAALRKDADAKRYQGYAEGARNAYRWEFLRNGVPDTDRQAKLVRPLALGLASEEQKFALAARLAQSVRNRGGRVGTGFLSTAFLPGVLTEYGYADEAYQTLENRERPGWLYEVDQGATTVWESWQGLGESKADTGSLNHYSPGAVCGWLFDTVLGIRVTGERRFTLCPVPGGSLTFARGSYLSPYGRVSSAWERTEDGYTITVTVPANTTACVCLPDGQTEEVGAGEHCFSWG